MLARYCNSRVAVFSPTGQHLHDITGDWTVVHSLVLYEPEDVLCVADREGQKVDCVGAGQRTGEAGRDPDLQIHDDCQLLIS